MLFLKQFFTIKYMFYKKFIHKQTKIINIQIVDKMPIMCYIITQTIRVLNKNRNKKEAEYEYI